MNELDRLPADAVVPIGARHVADLRNDARQAGHGWLHADCLDATDRSGVMAALAAGWHLPAHFGANLDALYDCLTDLAAPGGAAPRGWVLVVERLPGLPGFDDAQRDALLEVFQDAAGWWSQRGTPFRVLWSQRAGPAR
jgi:hypothetical protein